MKKIISLILIFFLLWATADWVKYNVMFRELSGDASGEQIVRCINIQNGHGKKPTFYRNGTFGYWQAADGDFLETISGRLGWHRTWIILLDRSADKVTAYDSFRRAGVMFSEALPKEIKLALGKCGVRYGGIWDGKKF